ADNWHFTQEDVRVNLMWGSQVLRKIAQQVRHSENKIVQVEKLSAMAYLANGFKPDQKQMDEAWRTLMLAQHHDSWIVPYNRLNKTNTWADEIEVWTDKTNDISNEIMQKSMQSFEYASTGNDYFIRVYNTVGILKNEVVTAQLPENVIAGTFRLLDADKKDISYSVSNTKTNKINFQAKVPAFGYATYQISKVKSVKKSVEKTFRKTANECTLENDMYKIVFDLKKGGSIKSLVAKTQGSKEYVSDNSDFLLGEIRGFFYEQNKFRSSAENKAKVTLVDNNAHKSTVRISGHIASHPFDQTVTISTGSAVIDFDLNIKWKHNEGIGEYKQQDNWQENRRAFCDDRFKLNVWFPVDLKTPKLYKNAPFDVCESRLNNTTFNTWDSIKHNVILNWIDLSEQENGDGLALFSDHTTSYTYGDKLPLGLTIQYSGKGLWGPDYKITGPTQLKYALVPHSQKWDKAAVQSKNTAWNEPLIAKVSKGLKSENRSFIDLKNSGYELSAVQITENGVLMRLFNAESNAGEQKVDIGFRFAEITEVELNGTQRQSDSALKNINANELTLTIPQFGIRNFYFKN
ncbi:MAG: glycoside hydrolase family 38 C-terminal domain-containing protein, partial [Paludibacter sp.]|nr:glycoside hydrolase family 38 C-terminal domain-containing protein [Paludibacter sp.]